MQQKIFTNKAFTLIELLVVVLIIGILAAIAVPQYQKAVAKAELAQIISITRNIKEAEELYFLANGKYSTSLTILDISIDSPDITCRVKSNQSHCYNKNFSILYYYENTENSKIAECSARTQNKNSPLVLACKDFLNKSYGALRDYGSCQLLWGSNKTCIVVSNAINF